MGRVRIPAGIALVAVAVLGTTTMCHSGALEMARVRPVQATATVVSGNSALVVLPQVFVPVPVNVSVSPGSTGDMLVAPIAETSRESLLRRD